MGSWQWYKLTIGLIAEPNKVRLGLPMLQNNQDIDYENCTKYTHRYFGCLKEAGSNNSKVRQCQDHLKLYEHCLIKQEIRNKQAKQ